MLLLITTVGTCVGSGSASSAGNSTARSDGFATAATACMAKASLLVIVTASYICFSYCPTIASARHGKSWALDLKMTSYMQRGRFRENKQKPVTPVNVLVLILWSVGSGV